jgi:hypothetical protein
VREARRLSAERAVKFNMFRGIRKMVLAANHVTDFHLDVIDHIHKMKNPRALRSTDRHVGMRAWIR